MQEHSHFIKSLPQLQKLYHKILLEVQDMYNHLVPLKLRQRRNIHQQYQKDFVIISVCLLGKMMGFTSERSWHSFAKANFFSGQFFPERSRYNRICRQLLWIIKFLRYQFIRRFLAQAPYTIVDSLPLPLCHSARSFRVKRLRGYADRGYCASKKEHYYGFNLRVLFTLPIQDS